jgi:hypothetical protein
LDKHGAGIGQTIIVRVSQNGYRVLARLGHDQIAVWSPFHVPGPLDIVHVHIDGETGRRHRDRPVGPGNIPARVRPRLRRRRQLRRLPLLRHQNGRESEGSTDRKD